MFTAIKRNLTYPVLDNKYLPECLLTLFLLVSPNHWLHTHFEYSYETLLLFPHSERSQSRNKLGGGVDLFFRLGQIRPFDKINFDIGKFGKV